MSKCSEIWMLCKYKKRSVLNAEKVWENVQNIEEVTESMRNCVKCKESMLNAEKLW